MKKTIALFLSSLSFGAVLCYSCSPQNSPTQESVSNITSVNTTDSTTTTPEGNYQDPNQASELALLMRTMYQDAESMKKAVMAGQLPADLREKFRKMHTAVPTEAEMKDETFKAMAEVFLKNMDKLYDNNNQIEDYNVLVQSCLACHQNHCPGPIPRIKKLIVQNNQ